MDIRRVKAIVARKTKESIIRKSISRNSYHLQTHCSQRYSQKTSVSSQLLVQNLSNKYTSTLKLALLPLSSLAVPSIYLLSHSLFIYLSKFLFPRANHRGFLLPLEFYQISIRIKTTISWNLQRNLCNSKSTWRSVL